jgi:hypothetical protein
MARSFTQVPPDSTGDKLTMQTFVVSSDTFHTQGVYLPGLPTYRSVSADITPANSKWHTYIYNASGSAQSVHILGLRYRVINPATVTGVINRFDFRRSASTTPTGGAAITAVANNSADPALANVTLYGGATGGISDGSLLESSLISSEEGTAVPTNTMHIVDQMPGLFTAYYPWGRPHTLRPGEGFGVKQNGAGAVNAFQWILDFAVEAD